MVTDVTSYDNAPFDPKESCHLSETGGLLLQLNAIIRGVIKQEDALDSL